MYKRELKSSELDRHFIHVDKVGAQIFPPKQTPFTLIVKGKKITVRLDKTSRIWAGGFGHLLEWRAGSVIEIKKDDEGNFVLEQTFKTRT
jgi:hypothetical protein